MKNITTGVCALILIQISAVYLWSDNNSAGKFQSMVNLALKQHPYIRVINARLRVKAKEEDIAGRIINPEIDTGFLFAPEEQSYEGEISYLHTFRTGGKGDKEKKWKKSQYRAFEAQGIIEKQHIIRKFILDAMRLQQIKKELKISGEIIRSFQRQTKRFSRIPRLSPRQEISRGIYRQIILEQSMERNFLEQEKTELLRRIRYALQDKGFNEKSFSLTAIIWPSIKERENIEGPHIALARQGLAVSRRLTALEEAKAWPNIKAGPVFSHRKEEGTAGYGVGASVSLPLPLYHRYNDEKITASRNRRLQKINLKNTMTRIKGLRSSCVKRYRRLVKMMGANFRPSSIERGHRSLHSYMRRGLVSPALVIEAHRQYISMIRTYHTARLKAMDLLLTVRSIDGELFSKEDGHEKK